MARLAGVVAPGMPYELSIVSPMHVKYSVHGDSIARRDATVSDLADFALRRIYRKDVGFRSYLPLSQRRAAIQKWQDIVGEHSSTDLERWKMSVCAFLVRVVRAEFRQLDGAGISAGWWTHWPDGDRIEPWRRRGHIVEGAAPRAVRA